MDFVSIVIVNYNGKHYLKDCLASIKLNDYPHYEIIVVDNHSSDGSTAFLDQQVAEFGGILKVIKLEKNFGPAKARNQGVRVARGEIIGFLDNDTCVERRWISEAAAVFQGDARIGCIQCKLKLQNETDKYDYAGDYLGQNGFLVQRASYGEIDTGQYDQQVCLLSAKSAGMFIKVEQFRAVNGFDEDYFIYVEETDLCWRVWLKGYKTVFAPKSIVFHHYASTSKIIDQKKSNQLVRFHGPKNYIMTLWKNLGLFSVMKLLPIHIMMWHGVAVVLLLRGDFWGATHTLRGIYWNFFHLSEVLKKRKIVQSGRFVDDSALFPLILKRYSVWKKIVNFFRAQQALKSAHK